MPSTTAICWCLFAVPSLPREIKILPLTPEKVNISFLPPKVLHGRRETVKYRITWRIQDPGSQSRKVYKDFLAEELRMTENGGYKVEIENLEPGTNYSFKV